MKIFEQINFKDEAWKFTPQALLKCEVNYGDEEFLSADFYMGPNEEKLSVQSWKDLESQGYIKIEEAKSFTHELLGSAQARKAKIASVFDHNLTDHKKNLKITFLKNMPSTLWLTIGYISSPIDFEFEHNVSVQMVFIEKELNNPGEMRLFPFNFNLLKESQVDLFFNLRASGSSASFSQAQLDQSSNLRVFGFYGGKSDYKRIDFRSFQQSENSEVTFNGLSLLKNKSVIDYHTDSFHLNKNQKTNQNYKTIGADQSKNIFGGRIHLTEPSEGAEVDQINRNILLSKKATIDTQPELNIDQDDVVATHGATISALNEDHFFYLASRGYQKDQARKLLVDAFCKDALLKDTEAGIHNYFISQIEEDLANV